MQAALFMLGLILFLVGLLTGFAVPALKNPRMALSAYANWLTALLAAAWGAGRKLAPIATVRPAVKVGVTIVIVGL
jgi:hydroxylaminobenzene mutase